MPLQLESYLQEIGRAGRDGLKSIALLLYSPGDEQLPYQLAEGELPSKEQLDFVYRLLEENKDLIKDLAERDNEILVQCNFSLGIPCIRELNVDKIIKIL